MFESNNLEDNPFDDLGEDVIAKFKWINMHSQEMEEVLKREEEL